MKLFRFLNRRGSRHEENNGNISSTTNTRSVHPVPQSSNNVSSLPTNSTFGEEDSSDLHVANQTFVAAHLIPSDHQTPQQSYQHPQPAPPPPTQPSPRTMGRRTRRVGLQEEDDGKSSEPSSMMAPGLRSRESAQAIKRNRQDEIANIPRTISFGKTPREKSSDSSSRSIPQAPFKSQPKSSPESAPAPPPSSRVPVQQSMPGAFSSSGSVRTRTKASLPAVPEESPVAHPESSQRRPRRKRSNGSSQHSRERATAAEATSEPEQRHGSQEEVPRRRKVWRRRRQRRSLNDSNSANTDKTHESVAGDPWNALELHPKLQQALLDVYWKRREEEMVRNASDLGQPDQINLEKNKPKLGQFLVEQEAAIESIDTREPAQVPPKLRSAVSFDNKSQEAASSFVTPTMPSPMALQSEATTQQMRNRGNDTSAAAQQRSLAKSMSLSPATPHSRPAIFKEVPAGLFGVAAVGRLIDPSFSNSSLETDRTSAIRSTAATIDPLSPGVPIEIMAANRKIETLALSTSQFGDQSHSRKDGENELPRAALPPMRQQRSHEAQKKLEDDSIYEYEEESLYEEISYYSSTEGENELSFPEEDYMNDEQLEVWMSVMSQRSNGNNDQGLSELLLHATGSSVPPSPNDRQTGRPPVAPNDISMAAYLQANEDVKEKGKRKQRKKHQRESIGRLPNELQLTSTKESEWAPTVPVAHPAFQETVNYWETETPTQSSASLSATQRSSNQASPSRLSTQSSFGIRTEFVCSFCSKLQSTKGNGWACDNFASPHMLCTDCVRQYVITASAAGGSISFDPTRSSCQLTCFGKRECQHSVYVNLWKIFEREEDIANVTGMTRHHQQRHQDTLSKASSSSNSVDRIMNSIKDAMKEALAHVRLRSCPNCNQSFVKRNDGCNKMTCPTCQTTSCYCCRKVIPEEGYEHFEASPRMNPQSSKCPLRTNDSIDQERDQQEMRRVLVDLANRVWEDFVAENNTPEIDFATNGGHFSESSLSASIADLIAGLPSEG